MATPRSLTFDDLPPDPTRLAEGELRKSGDTRRRILEAAVHCLATFGYSGTNAVTVAEQARLTRPAMLYHFPTRMALIEATVNFVTRERIAQFEAAIRHVLPLRDSVEVAVDMAWAQNQTPLYRAYCELANAAKTDPDLSAVFAPAMTAYDRSRRASASQLFSPAQQAAAGFHLRRDVVRFLLDGVAEHADTIEDAAARQNALIEFLKALVLEPEGDALLRKARARTGADE
jgi:AcrR family transcriptional regulator